MLERESEAPAPDEAAEGQQLPEAEVSETNAVTSAETVEIAADASVEEIDELVAVAVEADVSDAAQLDPEQFEAEPLTAEEIARWELARTALLEVTDDSTIGDPSDEVDEGDGVISYLFENTMAGYPGWKWTVTIAQVDGSEPTVLETELTPAEDALLAPEWVPWADRMDDYRAAQIALGELAESDEEDGEDSDEDESADSEDDSDDESDDEESDDESDESDDEDDEDEEFSNPVPVLHAGDVDGVDIDELDTADSDSDSDSDTDSDTDSNSDAGSEGDAADEAETATVEAEAPAETVTGTVDVPADPAIATKSSADSDRWAEPAPEPVKRARKSRRASSASIAQPTEGAPTES
jgi:hypothetical protein